MAGHLPVVAKAWLDEIRDFIDETRTSIGEFRRRGRALDHWATLNEADAPTLFGTEGWAQQCPVCGSVYTMIAGRQFFADPRVVGRPLIVGDHGIFVREDLALARGLRTPSGAFKPSVVKFLASPPAIRAAPTWDVEQSPTQPRTTIRPTLGVGLQRAVAAVGMPYGHDQLSSTRGEGVFAASKSIRPVRRSMWMPPFGLWHAHEGSGSMCPPHMVLG